MATLSITNPNLMDLARRLDPDDKIADICEMLTMQNEMIPDMTYVEGNLLTGHMTTIRTGLPTPTWKRINQRVIPGKSQTAQATFNTGHLEQFSEIDVDLAKLNGNTAAFRLSEDAAFLESMNQEVAQTLFYGNESIDPEEFTGLSYYYNDTTAESGDNIILGGAVGGQTDNQSIWLVCWGPAAIFNIIPKGSKAGLQHYDLGEETSETSAGLLRVLRSRFVWETGLVVRDWRYAVRIANIDKSLLSASIGTGADLAALMFDAIERLPNANAGRCAFYMSRKVRTTLRQQLSFKVASSTLTTDMVGGKVVTSFHGIPIRRCDILAADEALVV